MNSKLMKAGIAGAAVVALAAGGSTFAAYSDFGNVNGNNVAAGILKLDLKSDQGGAVAPVSWGSLAPGQIGVRRAVFIASSDGASVPPADLYVTIQNLNNHENGCDSLSEAQAENSAQVVTGTEDPKTLNCGTTEATNNNGELSKALDVRFNTFPADDAATCAAALNSTATPPGSITDIFGNVAGNLDTAAGHGAYLISGTAAGLTPLLPGHGLCVVIGDWFHGASDTVDNAAQGDSLSFDMKFDLKQTLKSFTG